MPPVKKILPFLLITAVCLASASTACANAYKILGVKSVKATAMGEAFIVQADDPSALAFNPAGLSDLRGRQLSLQASFGVPYSERSRNGTTESMVRKFQAIPSFFATSDFGRDDLAIGLGVSLPNGIATEWREDSFARYVATFSRLTVVDVNLGCGLRISPQLALGFGVSLLYSDVRLGRMIDAGLVAGAPGTMDTKMEIAGNGTTFGFNMGVIYSVNDMHGFAATYRGPFTINYDGTITMAGAPSDSTTVIDHPAVIVVGYAFRPNDKWKVEVNLDWTDWNSVDDIMLDFNNPSVADLDLAMGLENTLACKVGAEFAYSDNIALRWGYIYSQNATPEESWRPGLPDTDVHYLTAGLGYELDNLVLDIAFQLPIYETRTIDNNVDMNELASSSSIDGTYRTIAPCGSMSVSYRF
jgi:long-chain fatty acid transport protein